ncbi:hypothetical protein QLS71_015275 [Mariniflexile litorale]|uniref:Lipoprotein n=1 Tax=Mariniflexile litorale TaxID=3045158 RepID=A0AAU7EFM4_9FLAO|nr:hypothetical protein [Mariniflexile sp. KMM 9835]MDQ8213567.1 hypothetical protein [Mariniflexile sp. KMM 9835]
MKQLTIISILFFLVSCSSTFKIVEQPTDYSSVIKKGHITGVIFKENGNCFLCLQDKERFTPTIAEIEKAEQILKKKLKTVNSQRMNQIDNCPIIHKKLKSYRRQYFGYIEDNGNKIIYTTFNWNRYSLFDRLRGYYKDESEDWKKEKEMVLDGCSYHWEIKINLETEELFELGVNGIAENKIKNKNYRQHLKIIAV